MACAIGRRSSAFRTKQTCAARASNSKRSRRASPTARSVSPRSSPTIATSMRSSTPAGAARATTCSTSSSSDASRTWRGATSHSRPSIAIARSLTRYGVPRSVRRTSRASNIRRWLGSPMRGLSVRRLTTTSSALCDAHSTTATGPSQHGHSVQTMLEVYAAWTEGAKEADIEAIKQAMQSPPRIPVRIEKPTALIPQQSPEFGTDLALEGGRVIVSDGNPKENTGGERGIRTLEGLLTLTPLAGVRLRPLGHLSVPGKTLAAQALTGWARLPAKKGGHDTATARRFLGCSGAGAQ